MANETADSKLKFDSGINMINLLKLYMKHGTFAMKRNVVTMALLLLGACVPVNK